MVLFLFWKGKWIHTFPKGICPKVNVITRLEFELAYYNFGVQRFNHYTTRTPFTYEFELISDVLLLMDEQRQDHQLEPTYSSSVPILDVDLKTCWKQRTIEKGGEKGSVISVLMA